MIFMTYRRDVAVAYAHQWAYDRNPDYYRFDGIGGDCTSFISQCLFAGCGIMNYMRDTGWYYRSVNDRAPAWTGVEFLYRFLTGNKGPGPFAAEKDLRYAQPGDVVQLSFDGETFAHSLLVVETMSLSIATHTDDCDHRPLRSYLYKQARLLQIEGVRG